MTPREPEEWGKLELGSSIQLLLGWRDGSDLYARPVRMTDEVGEEIIEACRKALTRLANIDRHIYSGVPAIDSDPIPQPVNRDRRDCRDVTKR